MSFIKGYLPHGWLRIKNHITDHALSLVLVWNGEHLHLCSRNQIWDRFWSIWSTLGRISNTPILAFVNAYQNYYIKESSSPSPFLPIPQATAWSNTNFSKIRMLYLYCFLAFCLRSSVECWICINFFFNLIIL